MISLQQRIKAFSELGKILSTYSESGFPEAFEEIIIESYNHNKWFTRENVLFSIKSIADLLHEETMQRWIFKYSFAENENQKPKIVLVIMAGNIPLVGFHDFLSVLISGNIFMGKLSSDDHVLLPAVAEILTEIEPAFTDRIHFIEGKAEGFDAVIATGSDNSSRYFDYYFGKVPNIIRRSRSSMAVLTGNETEEELGYLTDDVCRYFGLGCRSVSKLFIPEGFDIRMLFSAFQKYSITFSDHNKYMNNYDYNKSIFLLNKTKSTDNGFILFTENASLASAVAVLNYQRYENISEVKKYVLSEKEKIQCVIGKMPQIENLIPFGKSQQPELWDYADGVDTIKFLTNIN